MSVVGASRPSRRARARFLQGIRPPPSPAAAEDRRLQRSRPFPPSFTTGLDRAGARPSRGSESYPRGYELREGSARLGLAEVENLPYSRVFASRQRGSCAEACLPQPAVTRRLLGVRAPRALSAFASSGRARTCSERQLRTERTRGRSGTPPTTQSPRTRLPTTGRRSWSSGSGPSRRADGEAREFPPPGSSREGLLSQVVFSRSPLRERWLLPPRTSGHRVARVDSSDPASPIGLYPDPTVWAPPSRGPAALLRLPVRRISRRRGSRPRARRVPCPVCPTRQPIGGSRVAR